jgi:hypothetical protein
MNDERCDRHCVGAPKAEAIREGLPGGEAAWVAAVAVVAVWLALAALAIFFMIRFV